MLGALKQPKQWKITINTNVIGLTGRLSMIMIRPRLIDHFNIPITQEEADFAIPFLDEDIPLFLDPFLLWKSPSQQDNSLHLSLVNAFNRLGELSKIDKNLARKMLVDMSECCEAGLGNGKTKRGLKISSAIANNILERSSSVI